MAKWIGGTLRLTDTSANQSVPLVAGTILYIGAQGRSIKLEDARTEPIVEFTGYNNARLDPGQDASQSVDVDVPADALTARTLKEIRLEQTVTLSVSIGGGQ